MLDFLCSKEALVKMRAMQGRDAKENAQTFGFNGVFSKGTNGDCKDWH
ncbi:hypothetical protein [Sphingobium herbicidovorans]|nr:hypothetical protein [Sphingobium herbicidovorans]